MKTRFGNFLADGVFDGFDNTFFRISPKEARVLEPQMRLLMRVGFQAVEAAGLLVDTGGYGARTSTAYSTLRGQRAIEAVDAYTKLSDNDSYELRVGFARAQYSLGYCLLQLQQSKKQ